MHGASDGAGQAIRRRRTDASDVSGALLIFVERQRTARQSENRVAIEGGVCRAHCARNPILRHHGHALAFHRGQIGIAGNHTQGRIGDGL